MSSPQSGPSRWQKLGQALRTKTAVFDLFSARYRHPARGIEREFVVVHAPDWVNVVALTPEGRLVLVRQFRYGIDEFSLELPGGVIEPGEDPIVAGLRELREETGYAGSSARLLGSVHPNPAIQSNRCHFVMVEAAVQSHAQDWDPDEEIHVSTEPVDDVLALARAGAISHGLVLDALMLFEPHWRAFCAAKSP
ncbi:MAG: NUDIX hydrolase [Opitutus sp.]|nr:NUDIX hydrolase [Opitutus sp.]